MVDPSLSFLGVFCNNPNHTQPPAIYLRHPIPLEKLQSPSDLLPENWRAYLACFDCGLVFEYLPTDVRLLTISDKAGLDRLRRSSRFYVICIECEAEDCEVPIKIQFYDGLGLSLADVENKIKSGNVETLRCDGGFPPKMPRLVWHEKADDSE
jgi:hypothetical protein